MTQLAHSCMSHRAILCQPFGTIFDEHKFINSLGLYMHDRHVDMLIQYHLLQTVPLFTIPG